MNGGGWLQIRGHHVDFLYREIGAVREAIEDCIAGRPRSIHQLGHPLGFHIQIYAGEVHVCRPLFDSAGTVAGLKSLIHEYPEKFRTAVVTKHLFDAEFEISIAAKPAERGDVMYVAGCLFRAAGFMTLVLYALNRRFYLNEKGAFIESRGILNQAAALSRHCRKRAGQRRHHTGANVDERRQLPEPGCGIAPTRDRRAGALAVASFQRALDFAIGRSAREHVALVVRVLALGESQARPSRVRF